MQYLLAIVGLIIVGATAPAFADDYLETCETIQGRVDIDFNHFTNEITASVMAGDETQLVVFDHNGDQRTRGAEVTATAPLENLRYFYYMIFDVERTAQGLNHDLLCREDIHTPDSPYVPAEPSAEIAAQIAEIARIQAENVDVGVTLDVSDKLKKRQHVDVSFDVFNNGGTTAENVQIKLEVHKRLPFVSSSLEDAPDRSRSGKINSYVWTLDPIASGESESVDVTFLTKSHRTTYVKVSVINFDNGSEDSDLSNQKAAGKLRR